MIAEGGTESVTMRALSDRVGVSRSAPYRHFPEKTTLLCAIAEEGFRELRGRLDDVARDCNQCALERFERTATAYVDFALSNAAHYRLMFSDTLLANSSDAGLRAAARSAFDYALRAIEECQAEGSMRQGDSVALANASWATLHGLSILLLDRQLLTDGYDGDLHSMLASDAPQARDGEHRRFIETAIRTLTDGMKPRTGGDDGDT